MLQQSKSDTKLLQGDTGIISTTTMNSTAFFFTKHLVGLRAATSHKLNHLLYLQGSENQRGSSSGGQAIQGFLSDGVGTKLHEARRECQHNPCPPPVPSGTRFGQHSGCAGVTALAARARSCRSPRQPRPPADSAPSPCGRSRRAGAAGAAPNCWRPLPACFLPSSCPAPSGGRAAGSPPPRQPAGPPLPSGPGRVRCQVPAPPAPAGPCARGQRRKRGLRHSGARWGHRGSLQGAAKRRPQVPPRRESGPAGLGPAVPAPAPPGRHAAPTHLPQAPAPRAGRPALPGLEARPRKG